MPKILHDASPDELASANNLNFQGYLRLVVESTQSGRFEWIDGAFRYWTGIADRFCNGVVGADLHPDQVNRSVQSHSEYFATRGLPWVWVVSPEASAELCEGLAHAGLQCAVRLPAMAVDLSSGFQDVLNSDRVMVAEATDPSELSHWVRIVWTSYNLLPEAGEMMAAPGRAGILGPSNAIRYYVAFLDGNPCATALLYLSEEVGGLYCVATTEDSRGHGLGTAVTIAAINAAKQAGYRYVTLQSSAMGRSIYDRLGFQENGDYAMYFLHTQ